MKTLTLDIATHVGFTVLEGEVIVESGSLELASEAELKLQRKQGKERTLDIRFTRLWQFIKVKIAEGVTRIVFEDVTFSSTAMQTQLWSSLRAAIWAVAQESMIEIFCVPVSPLKVFATGGGDADKIDMARALAQAEPDLYTLEGDMLWFKGRIADDDEVDAIWLAKYAIAVDRGSQRFLSAYQRDCIRREEKRRKRREMKAARKAREKVRQNEAKARRQQLKHAVKDAGRCCGVLRVVGVRNRATCPKCGGTIRLDIEPLPKPEVVRQSSSEPQPESPI